MNLDDAEGDMHAEIQRLKARIAELEGAGSDLLESLQHATAIIRKHVPDDALGMNSAGGGDGWNDQSWPLLDEYLHYMDEAIKKGKVVLPAPPNSEDTK